MLTELKTFLAVVRYGTFDRAGCAVGLTQSAVSAQVRRLEDYLGAPVFDRVGRKAELNAFGQQTATRAEDLIADMEQLRYGTPRNSPRNVVHIAAISTQSVWLVRALAAFQRVQPDIHLRIIPGASHVLAGQVDAGEIDLAVIIRPPYQLQPELQWHSLGLEPYFVLVPASYPGNDGIEAIRTQPFIRYDRYSYGGRIVDQFLRAHGLRPVAVLETDDISGLVEAVAQGMGVTITPAIEPDLPLPSSVRAISLEQYAVHREIGVVVRERPLLADLIQQLLGYLAEHAAKSYAATWRYLADVGSAESERAQRSRGFPSVDDEGGKGNQP